MNDDLIHLLPKNDKAIIELFYSNADGKCFLSRRVFEDGLCKPRVASGMTDRTLSNRLDGLQTAGVIEKVICKDGGVFYVLSSFAKKYPKSIDMVRKAETRGSVSAIFLIEQGSPDVFTLLNLKVTDPEKVPKRGRPTTFQSEKSP